MHNAHKQASKFNVIQQHLMQDFQKSMVTCIISNRAFVSESVNLNEKYLQFVEEIGGIEKVNYN